jgi:transcriptional regulator GlxA family with amidase domain
MTEHPGSEDGPRPPLRSVAVLIDEGVAPFEFAIPCEVFGVDRSAQGLPVFDFAVCAPQPGPVRTSLGFEIVAQHGLEPLRRADLLVVPAMRTDYEPSAEVVEAMRAVVARGGRVASMCSGAFALARAGCWTAAGPPRTGSTPRTSTPRSPTSTSCRTCSTSRTGPVLTSAGTAAGIDLCLHIVRQSHGAAAANGIARRMVVPPHREGGQAQFIETPMRATPADTLAATLEWASAHLDEDLSVSRLAKHAAMSERTFARRFRSETGTTPHHWVLAQRVALAEQLLEQGTLGVEEIARRCGFGSATMLRHHFARMRSTTPTAYRRLFAGPAQAERVG